MNKLLVKSVLAAAALTLSAVAFAEVSVTTGAGYQPMVKELNAAFEKATGKKVVENFSGPIGQMVSQIASGSGVNVVISDKGTLKGVNKNNVEFSVEQNLGQTPLVFVWGKNVKIDGIKDLDSDKVKSFAMPDPKAAIYGRAATAYLQNKGLTEKLKDKTMAVSTVPQVIAYVTKGEVDAGFVNRSAARNAKDKLGGVQEVTEGYPKIEMTVNVVKGSEGDADIQSYLKFLQTEEAKKILDKHGVS